MSHVLACWSGGRRAYVCVCVTALFPKYPQAFSCKVLPTTRTELSLGRPTRLSVEGEERWELWELRAVPITRSGVFRQAGLRDSTGGAPGVGLRTEG